MNTAVKVYETEAAASVSVEERDRLVMEHLPLVKYLVGRIAMQLPSHLDQQDLMSVALIGLITAAERFDPNRGVQFKTYAEQRIKGTVMDELRAQDWLSRTLRGKYKRLEREFSALEQRLKRNPTSEEVAQALDMDLEEYFRLLEDVHLLSFVSLDESMEDDEGMPFGLLDILEDTRTESAPNQLIGHQMVQSLGEAIDTLPEKERIIITLYYYEELKLKEIGEILHLTESRISQLHSQAVMRLRTKLKTHIER